VCVRSARPRGAVGDGRFALCPGRRQARDRCATYARVPSTSRASGGRDAESRAGERSQRTGPRPPRSDGGAVMWVPGPRPRRSRVVPAHAVEQTRQVRRGTGGDEELGPAVRGGRHRPDGETHALQPGQRTAAGGLGHLDDVEGPAHRQHHRRAGELAPHLAHVVQRRPGRQHGSKAQGVRTRSGAVAAAAGAGARRGAGTRHHVPAPQAGELGDGRAVRGAAAAAAARAGPDVAHAPADADREAHAPSNGCDAAVVTQRTRRVTLCSRLPGSRAFQSAPGGAGGGVSGDARPRTHRCTHFWLCCVK
jgi:hypothetical protein